MAIYAHSTTAPALQPRLLPFVFQPVPPVNDPRSAVELLDEIRRTIERQSDEALAAAESTASQPCSTRHLAPEEALASTAQPLLPADTPEAVRSDLEALLADHGRAIHCKRALHEAFDFGFALLDALDLSPLALDVIDHGIAALDALDADSEDLEDDDPAEGTSLERFGRGLVRAGADDAEDSHDAEPSLGARNPTWGSLGDSVSQVGWAMGSDDTDREHDSSDAEPYLSVVEFDGRGDNWGRTGNATSGYGTDVEDSNEDGSDDGRTDPGWCLGEMDVALVVRGMFEDARRGVHA